jgi:hypothetical protein
MLGGSDPVPHYDLQKLSRSSTLKYGKSHSLLLSLDLQQIW